MKSIDSPPSSPSFGPEKPKDGESSDKAKKLFVYDIQRNEAKIVRRDSISSKINHTTDRTK